MKIKLTTNEKTALLKEVLTGSIETDNFKRLFQQDKDQPIFNILPSEGACKGCDRFKNIQTQTDEELKRDVKELLRKCDGLL